MGLEARCTARWKKQVSEGTAHLEEKNLLFRGDFRLRIPLQDIASAEARRGVLTVKFAEGTASFDLGPAAEKWALKIRYPRGLLEKLGVKPGQRISVLDITDKDFLRQLRERGVEFTLRKPQKNSDLIFFVAESRDALKKLKALERAMQRTGAIWVVYPKGQKHITEADVMAASKAAGFVDVKVCSFSETHTALKLMIPLARR